MPKFKNRVMCAVLYEEDETHKKAIDYIIKNYNSAVIRHDMDTYDEDSYNDDGSIKHTIGELKKPHYHVIIKFPNGRYNTSVADDLGITENYLEPCNNYEKALLYLIHYNNPDKYLYKVDDVQGSLKKDLIKYINKHENNEELNVSKIFEWIHEQSRPLTITKLSKYCYENGLWSVYRRSSSIFFRVLDEYNYLNSKGLEPNHVYYHDEKEIEKVLEQLEIEV